MHSRRREQSPRWLTKPNHPWTNGQVERMNRTIKEATVKRHHYDSHDQLRRHLQDFIEAYNFGRRLKTLKGLTPYEYSCNALFLNRIDSASIQSIKCQDQTPKSNATSQRGRNFGEDFQSAYTGGGRARARLCPRQRTSK